MNNLGNNLAHVLGLTLLITIGLLPVSLSAQTSVSGLIANTAGDPVISAQITVIDHQENSILTSALSGLDGKYSFTVDNMDSVRIEISALFFERLSALTVLAPGEVVKNYILKSKGITLNEVAIKAKRPVTVKNDTTIYDASFYSRGDEVVAEDLLRSIPGVSVDQSGRITVQGREVEKVMIDDDDFFEKGYRTMTRSLRASLIEQIEVLDNYSTQSQLKGIEHSDKVALNLKLSKEARSKTFGDVAIAGNLASLSGYEGDLNLINLRNKHKFYLLLSTNNIGENTIDDIENSWAASSITDNSTINYQRSISGTASLNVGQPAFRFNRSVANRLRVGSLSGITRLGESIKITPRIIGLFDRQTSASISETRFTGEQAPDIINVRNMNNTTVISEVMARVDVEIEIDKQQMLTARSSFRTSNNSRSNQILLNSTPLNEQLADQPISFQQRVVYLKTLSDNSALLLTAFGGYDEYPEGYHLSDNVFSPLFSQDMVNGPLTQYALKGKRHLHLESHLFLNGKNTKKDRPGFEILAGIKGENNGFTLQHKSGPMPELQNFDFNEETSRFATNNMDHYLTGIYAGKTRKFQYQFKAGIHHFISNGTVDGILTETRSNTTFLPRIQFEYKFAKKESLEINLSRGFSTPNVTDWFPGTFATNSSSVRGGLTNLNMLLTSLLSVTHTHGLYSDRFTINSSLSYRYDHEYLSTTSTFADVYLFQEPLRLEGRQMLQFSSSASRYFPALRNSLKLSVGIAHSSYEDQITGIPEARSIGSFNGSMTLEVRSTFKGAVNYHIGAFVSRSAFNGDANNVFQQRRFFTDLNFRLSKKFRAQLMAESILFVDATDTPRQIWLLDGNANYQIIKSRLSCSLTLRNLLNSRWFDTFQNTAVSRSFLSYQLLPAQIMLGIKYTI